MLLDLDPPAGKAYRSSGEPPWSNAVCNEALLTSVRGRRRRFALAVQVGLFTRPRAAEIRPSHVGRARQRQALPARAALIRAAGARASIETIRRAAGLRKSR